MVRLVAEYGRAALATDVDLVVSQGADNTWAFRYGTRPTPEAEVVYPDLTQGWDARAQFRNRPGGEVWATFTTPPDATGTGISLGADGTVHLHLHHTVTEAPAWDRRKAGVWDLELVGPDGEVTRLVMGKVTVSPDVTRAVA